MAAWARIAVTWIQVEFLDASTNLLALYKSANYSASVGLDTWFQYSGDQCLRFVATGCHRRSVFHHLRGDGHGKPVGGAIGDDSGPLPVLPMLQATY